MRRYVEVLKESERCHPGLMACFDEVWTCLYEPPSKVHVKQTPSSTIRSAATGNSFLDARNKEKLDKMSKDLKQSLGIQTNVQNDGRSSEANREACMLEPVQGPLRHHKYIHIYVFINIRLDEVL